MTLPTCRGYRGPGGSTVRLPSASVLNISTPSVTVAASAPSATAILLAALRATSSTTSTTCSGARWSCASSTTRSGTAYGVQIIVSVRASAAFVAGGRSLSAYASTARKVASSAPASSAATDLRDRQ